MLTLLAVTTVAFMTLERLDAASDRVSTRYSPQLDRISNVQLLMFRISLEARHTMLLQVGLSAAKAFNRIGGFRQEMLDKLEAFEPALTTPEGEANAAKIREADKLFWRLAGDVVGKIQAGEVSAAFAQLDGELVAGETMPSAPSWSGTGANGFFDAARGISSLNQRPGQASSRQSLQAVARSTMAADNLRSHAQELERATAAFHVYRAA